MFFQTLVYVRGEILDSFNGYYSDLLGTPSAAEGEVSRRMEEQHKRVVHYVKSGKYDVTPDWSQIDCQGIFGGRPLEEAVLEYIREEGDFDVLELALTEPLRPRFSASLMFGLQARLSVRKTPVHGAEVSVKLVSNLDNQFSLAEGRTDRDGGFMAYLCLPPSQPGNCTMLVTCVSEYGNDAIEAPITV
jgi:hypothetical protein